MHLHSPCGHRSAASFRVPARVTFTDSKREGWFTDLANPLVPLTKLGKSVPHGAKNQDLLEHLYKHNVAIHRAIWFLRVFGANETAGLRNKPSYNPSQYSVDWAGVVTSYIKKQLGEISLPSAPRPGVNIKSTFKGQLGEVGSRDRWVQRFAYTLLLLRSFYAEDMVDHRTLLVWLIHQMNTCNLAQAGFVARIADEYLQDMLASLPLARHFVDACVTRLAEATSSTSPELLVDVEYLLRSIIQRLCLAIPDAFVSPKLWSSHSNLVEATLLQDILDVSDPSNASNVRQALDGHLFAIRRRNEAMLFVSMPPLAPARLGSSVQNITVSLTSSTMPALTAY